MIIILLAFMSYLTATFMIESMASANAIVHHRRLQRLKRSSTSSSSAPDVIPTDEAVLINNAPTGSPARRSLNGIEASHDPGRASPSNFHYVNSRSVDLSDDENEPLLVSKSSNQF